MKTQVSKINTSLRPSFSKQLTGDLTSPFLECLTCSQVNCNLTNGFSPVKYRRRSYSCCILISCTIFATEVISLFFLELIRIKLRQEDIPRPISSAEASRAVFSDVRQYPQYPCMILISLRDAFYWKIKMKMTKLTAENCQPQFNNTLT